MYNTDSDVNCIYGTVTYILYVLYLTRIGKTYWAINVYTSNYNLTLYTVQWYMNIYWYMMYNSISTE